MVSLMAAERGVPLLATRGVGKRFGSVVALSGVDFAVGPGEVVGLVGDNGAGKSTLVKIMAGALAPTVGHIEVEGAPAHFSTPMEAREIGIECVYQDLALAPDLSVWANLFLGRERLVPGPLRAIGWLDKRAMAAEAANQLQRMGMNIGSVETLCESLSGGQRQSVAVLRAVAWGTKVLLLDEPTAALGVEQQGKVDDMVRSVRAHGLSVVYISHNLPAVHRLCDRIVVLRLGHVVAALDPAQATVQDVVAWITGAAGKRAGGAPGAAG